jgi:hypothetical protein
MSSVSLPPSPVPFLSRTNPPPLPHLSQPELPRLASKAAGDSSTHPEDPTPPLLTGDDPSQSPSNKRTDPSTSRSASPSSSSPKKVRSESGDGPVEQEVVSKTGESDDKAEEAATPTVQQVEEQKPTAIFNMLDNDWRCTSCLWTIHCGVCDGCHLEYEISDEMKTHDAKVRLRFLCSSLSSPHSSPSHTSRTHRSHTKATVSSST